MISTLGTLPDRNSRLNLVNVLRPRDRLGPRSSNVLRPKTGSRGDFAIHFRPHVVFQGFVQFGQVYVIIVADVEGLQRLGSRARYGGLGRIESRHAVKNYFECCGCGKGWQKKVAADQSTATGYKSPRPSFQPTQLTHRFSV